MSGRIPESREVWEHANREFDRIDNLYSKALFFLIGMVAGVCIMGCLGVIL